MKAIRVRDLRQHWPKVEALLRSERELAVTRDGKPVATLVRMRETVPARRRFDPRAHARWQARTSGRTPVRWVEAHLLAERAMREFGAVGDLPR